MSLTPNPSPQLSSSEVHTGEPVPEERKGARRWPRRVLTLCFALFTLEIGLFLVLFPWTDKWDFNYFQSVIPALQDLWYEPSFRGALTGLGLVNVYIACMQFIYFLRRS
jgi:hypothetical protein